MSPRLVFLFVCVIGLGVQAQSFEDDVETGNLVTPGGNWTGATTPVSANTITASTAAAHRGSYGVRLTDNNNTANAGDQNNLEFESADAAPDYYWRGWMRLTPTNTVGEFTPIELLCNDGSNSIALVDISVTYPSAAFILEGDFNGGAGSSRTVTTAIASAGTWNLVEVVMHGIGTTSGSRRLLVNGVSRAYHSNLNFTSASYGKINQMNIGASWSNDRRWTGTIDFDDVRASTSDLASSLRVTAGGASYQAGTCIALTLGLRESVAAAAAHAPYAVQTSLNVSGVTGSFFSNSGCTTPITTLTIPSGVSLAPTSYFRATSSGTAVVTASHADFLTSTLNLTITAPPAVAIAPATVTLAPKDTQLFTASGGSGSGYVWSMSTKPSGGTISAGGAYTAGGVGGVTDVVSVQDSLGGTKTVQVQVGPALSASPLTTNLASGAQATVTASGGKGPYTFAMQAAPSGGSVTAAGLYTAGALGGVTDVVRVTDALGATATSAFIVAANGGGVNGVRVSGATTMTAGSPLAYTLQVVDGAGNDVTAPTNLSARLLPVGAASSTAIFSASTLGGPSGLATSSGLTAANGRATVTINDPTAERILVCARITSGTIESCLEIAVGAGAAHHTRVWTLGPTSLPACSSATVSMAVVDVNGNVVTTNSMLTLCPPTGSAAKIGNTTLLSEARAGSCVTGQLGASGTATATVSSGTNTMATFTASSTGMPGPATGVTLSWQASAGPTATSSGITVDSSLIQAHEGPVVVSVVPLDACGQPATVLASDVAVLATPPLVAGAPQLVNGEVQVPVTLPVCPAAGATLWVSATLKGQPITDAQGVVKQILAFECAPPLFLTPLPLEARCGTAYNQQPSVSGDGPFTFALEGSAPEGLEVASETGVVSWTPTAQQTGIHSVNLKVHGPAGDAHQSFDLEVSCARQFYGVNNGCGSTGGSLSSALALVLALFVRRRRAAR
jgi:hypothetical protein